MLRALCRETQRAGYRSGNVRKLAACVRVYGGVAAAAAADGDGTEDGDGDRRDDGDDTEDNTDGDRREAAREARRRLGALLSHPWPRVRSAVVDEVWALPAAGDDDDDDRQLLLGVDWAGADRERIRGVVEALRLGP
ncbi:hypothetical protein CDD83_3930 [Cordyceps sp. RAO-2017]|nr:hypothetical protein CDD83_3930 [Cordyceps sp. RAO-2017]